MREATNDFFSRRYPAEPDVWASDSEADALRALGSEEGADDDDEEDLVENLLLLKEGAVPEGTASLLRAHRSQRGAVGVSLLHEANNPEDGGSGKGLASGKQKEASRSQTQRHETVHVSSPMKMTTPARHGQPPTEGDADDSAEHYTVAIDTPENADDTSLERHLHIHTTLDRLHTHLHIHAQPHTHVHIHALT